MGGQAYAVVRVHPLLGILGPWEDMARYKHLRHRVPGRGALRAIGGENAPAKELLAYTRRSDSSRFCWPGRRLENVGEPGSSPGPPPDWLRTCWLSCALPKNARNEPLALNPHALPV
jgi:hypothetical protein